MNTPPLIIESDDTLNDQSTLLQTEVTTLPSLCQSNTDPSDSEHSFTSIQSQSPIGSSSKQSLNMANQNAAVCVKKIAFWTANPKAWFRVIETQFSVSRITEEVTKFNHVISMLDPETVNKCMDIIETVSSDEPFTDFRDRVIARMSESEQSRL